MTKLKSCLIMKHYYACLYAGIIGTNLFTMQAILLICSIHVYILNVLLEYIEPFYCSVYPKINVLLDIWYALNVILESIDPTCLHNYVV